MSDHIKIKVFFSVYYMMIIIVMSVFVSSGMNAANTEIKVFTDNNGGFYIIKLNETTSCGLYANSKRVSNIMSENTPVLSCAVCKKHVDFVFTKNDLLIIKEMKDSGNIYFLDEKSVKTDCFCTDGSGIIYIVSETEPCTVKAYRNGVLYSSQGITKKILSLFTCFSDDRVYAITESGIFDALNGHFIPCEIPDGKIKFNRDKCTDSDGNYFTFSPSEGLVNLLQTEYKQICPMINGICASEGNTLYLIDIDGECVGYYNFAAKISNIFASGNSIAVINGDNISVINTSDFSPAVSTESVPDSNSVPVPVTSSSVQEKSSLLSDYSGNYRNSIINNYDHIVSRPVIPDDSDSSENHNDPDSVPGEIVTRKTELTSDKYIISDGVITNIPQGTTIAQFKKNTAPINGSLTFFNYNGKVIKNGKMGTGLCVVATTDTGSHYYYTVIKGDVTGEGNINSLDVNLLIDYLIGKDALNDIQLMAADIDDNDTVDSIDVLRLYWLTPKGKYNYNK